MSDVDRLTRASSVMTLAVAIGIATQVDLISGGLAVLSIWFLTAIGLVQIVLGIVEHSRSLKEAIGA